MPLRTFNTKNTETPWTHWFIYGDTGSGKTTMAATFPRPIFLCPANEHSMTTLIGRDFPYFLITDRSSPLVDARGGLESVIEALENEYERNLDDFPYDTIVIESLTHYCDLVQEELTQGGSLMMDPQKWGKLASHLRNIQARLRNMDVHVVFTALAKTDKDASDQIIGGPLIPGSMGYKLPSSCDVIGYAVEQDMGRNRPKKYCLHLSKHKWFPARTRFPRLPRVVEDFNFEKLRPLLTREEESNG